MKLGRLSIAGGGKEGVTFRDRLSKWQIEIESGAVEVTAIVLKPPTIQFGNKTDRPMNGSFNLNRTLFARYVN
jgi:hypothetical protein